MQYEDDIAYFREKMVPQVAVSKEMCHGEVLTIDEDRGKVHFAINVGGEEIYPGYMVFVLRHGKVIRTGIVVSRHRDAMTGKWVFDLDLPPLPGSDDKKEE